MTKDKPPQSPTTTTQVTHKQECTQRAQFLRSILVTGAEENQVISSLLIESSSAVVGDDGLERETTKWAFEREAGETMTMGMFANGMQQAIVLQPGATTLADRVNVIHLRHCTEKTVANETSIVVDAATKAGPMCKLIVQVQQKSGGGDGHHIGSPPLRQGCPGPWYLGWLLLARRGGGTHRV
jgi:hypothetical protein